MSEANDFHAVLDAVDWRLLRQLQADASLTNQALAERCHLSAPTCLRRVRRLHELGLVERTVAILDGDALRAQGVPSLTAVVEVTLDVQAEEQQRAFEARAVADAAVQQCYRVSPGPDFCLVLVMADMPAYHAVAQRLFTAHAQVRNVRVFFSVKRAKFETTLPIPLNLNK